MANRDMQLFEINFKSDLPVWIQLRNRFIYLINTGYYAPGDQLPSVRSLAADIAVNYNTVSKVYSNLTEDGYLESVRGKGVYVKKDFPQPEKNEQQAAHAILNEAIRHCMSLGLSLDDTQVIMRNIIDEIQDEYNGK